MKSAGLRIRIEPELRDSFVCICKKEDKSAAQVLRAFMRDYVDKKQVSKQQNLLLVTNK